MVAESVELANFSPEEFDATVRAVTSAFGDATRREIYLFVRAHTDGVRASEVATEFSLHANVARHHLEKLAAGGYLDVELQRHGANGAPIAGRPSKRYRVSTQGTAVQLPSRRDDLLATLLARALELLPPEQAETMADAVGYEYGRALAERMAPGEDALGRGQRSMKSALVLVADALTAHGFAAHAEARGPRLQIINDHCPFGTAALEYPQVVCAVDKGMIRGMLAGLAGETEPHVTERKPDGDAQCVVQL
ncbi:MAG: helix-turn-helix transcriptional regulator [Acidimicrobiia bacterium]